MQVIESIAGNPVLVAISGVLAMLASHFLGKLLKKWFQAYLVERQKREQSETQRHQQDQNQWSNQESDNLKEIDGR